MKKISYISCMLDYAHDLLLSAMRQMSSTPGGVKFRTSSLKSYSRDRMKCYSLRRYAKLFCLLVAQSTERYSIHVHPFYTLRDGLSQGLEGLARSCKTSKGRTLRKS
jgi:hypothetical protein